MSCFQTFSTKVGNCLENLKLKRKPRKHLDISGPFNFKQGPAVNFPGYSEDDISLMREKAIASTAVPDEVDFDLSTRIQRPRSRASSHGCGLGSRISYHTRRVSRANIH